MAGFRACGRGDRLVACAVVAHATERVLPSSQRSAPSEDKSLALQELLKTMVVFAREKDIFL